MFPFGGFLVTDPGAIIYRGSTVRGPGSPTGAVYPAGTIAGDLCIIQGRSGGTGWLSRTDPTFGSFDYKFVTSADLAAAAPLSSESMLVAYGGVEDIGLIRTSTTKNNNNSTGTNIIPGFTKSGAARLLIGLGRGSGVTAATTFPSPWVGRAIPSTTTLGYTAYDLAENLYTNGSTINGSGSSSGILYWCVVELF